MILVAFDAVMLISPPHVQAHLQPLLRAYCPLIFVAMQPVVQGFVTAGKQTAYTLVCVYEALSGFVSDLHCPNGGMLVVGAKAETFAANVLAAFTICAPGKTARTAGTVPNVHSILDPWLTRLLTPLSRFWNAFAAHCPRP